MRGSGLEEFGFSHPQIFKIPKHWMISGEEAASYPCFSSRGQMFLKEKEGLGQRMWHLNPSQQEPCPWGLNSSHCVPLSELCLCRRDVPPPVGPLCHRETLRAPWFPFFQASLSFVFSSGEPRKPSDLRTISLEEQVTDKKGIPALPATEAFPRC